MNHINTQIGKRIKEIRNAKGLTQEALAEKVEISPRYLSRLEVGQQSPSVETLAKLAQALNVEVQELFVFGHHGTANELRGTLRKWIQEADVEKLRMLVKICQAVLH